MAANRNYWLKGGVINIFQNLLTVLFGFLSFYLLLRLLTEDQYGTWILFLSTISILEIGRNGLTQEAAVKYLSSADEADRKKINTAVFVINTLTTIVIGIVIAVLAPVLGKTWESAEITRMLYLYLLVFYISGLLNQFNCIEQASLSFTGIFYSNITRQLILFGYVLFCYLSHRTTSVIFLTYVQMTGVVLATIIAFIYSRKKIIYARLIDWSWVKKVFNFGKYTFGVSLSAILSSSIDQMMLGSLLSKAASGVFNIAVRITNLVDIPTNAMVAVVYPQSSIRASEQGDNAVKYLYEKSVGVILSILVPFVLFLYLFADVIVHFIASTKYENAIPLLKITLLTCILSPFARQTGTVLTSTGKTKLNFHLILISTSIIIITNFILIKQYGVMGAAYSTLVTSLISFFICQFILKKYYGVNYLNSVKYALAFYPEFFNKYIRKKG